ncbi:MAG TPA: ParB N-terminal domain-containing protein, partial [Symbiobacteriaceae bacterium]|nr:ParB N-terminal domain-containing protein [Symbiobacteriaceae bacterium]
MDWLRRPMPSFDQAKAKLNLQDSCDLGVMTVEVDRIIGSVGRWRDFDASFRLTNPATKRRFEIISQKMQEGYEFPPVELYKVQDRYYVADGNHRVAAAKSLGVHYIDAHVREFFADPEHEAATVYWAERSAFEKATGRSDLDFARPDHYRRLLSALDRFRRQETKRHGYDLELPAVAQTWKQDIATPVRRIVRREGLTKQFPGWTEDDVVLHTIRQNYGLMRAIRGPELANYREAIAELVETHNERVASWG